MNKLGDLLKNVRENCGLSIKELANSISISRMTLTRLEENKTKIISLQTIINISNSLNLDLCKIVKAYGKKLKVMDIKNVLTTCKTIFYEGQILDKKKFEELIKNNIINLQKQTL